MLSADVDEQGIMNEVGKKKPKESIQFNAVNEFMCYTSLMKGDQGLLSIMYSLQPTQLIRKLQSANVGTYNMSKSWIVGATCY